MSKVRLIDANALKEEIIKKRGLSWERMQHLFCITGEELDNAPTVYPICEDKACKYRANERPKGEWKPTNVPFGTCFLQGYECKCGRVVMQKENFCPECGADMRGKEE